MAEFIYRCSKERGLDPDYFFDGFGSEELLNPDPNYQSEQICIKVFSFDTIVINNPDPVQSDSCIGENSHKLLIKVIKKL